MFKGLRCFIFRIILCFTFIILLLNYIITCYTHASVSNRTYYIVYQHLYNYHENYSHVLNNYRYLKTRNKDVYLQGKDRFLDTDVKENDLIIIGNSDLDDKRLYQPLLDSYPDKVIFQKDLRFHIKPDESDSMLFLAIDKIYPFSDLNMLMDTADFLYDRGIEFIFIVMPVYRNYHLEIYDSYIEVLLYVQQKGGTMFLHYPVLNKAGTYNIDPRPGFERSFEEYISRNLDVKGVKISLDNVFNNNGVIEGLNLPYVIASNQEGRVINGLDIDKIAYIMRNQIFFTGNDINDFNLLSSQYKSGERQAIFIDINSHDLEQIETILTQLNSHQSHLRSFSNELFDAEVKLFLDTIEIMPRDEEPVERTELEEFLEREILKIVSDESEAGILEKPFESYDITSYTRVSIRVGIILIGILLVMIAIGRKFYLKKYFK